MVKTQTLVDHDAIREWAKARGATPARVTKDGKDAGTLAFDFHEGPGFAVRPIGWASWFSSLDHAGLALLIQTSTPESRQAYRLVKRSTRRVKTGAARRHRRRVGGDEPIGNVTRAAAERPKPATWDGYEPRIPPKDHTRGRRRGAGASNVRRSEQRAKSNARRPPKLPRG
jgi:hypothetical protein